MLVGATGVVIVYKLHYWVEKKFKLDDAVGAVAVHGYAGVVGLILVGFILWVAPSSPFEGYAPVTPWGQAAGAVIMFFVLGFLPAYLVSRLQAAAGALRIPEKIEFQGLDYAEHHAYEDAKAEIIKANKQHLATKSGTAAK